MEFLHPEILFEIKLFNKYISNILNTVVDNLFL